MNVASLLAKKGVRVITIGPGDPIREALRRLAEHNIGALVVLDGPAGLAGIVSERDIVRALARSEGRSEAVLAQPIATIMTRDVVVGTPQDDLVAVGVTMTEKHIRHLPVVEAGRLVGIISIGDVVKTQRDQYQGEVATLQFQLLNEEDVNAPRAS
jgi:CBS domain-containing protein